MILYPDEIKRLAHMAAHEVARAIIQKDAVTIPPHLTDSYKDKYEEIYKFIVKKLNE